MKQLLILVFIFITVNISSQNEELTSKLYETYSDYKEPSLNKRRVKHRDLQPLFSLQ